MPMEIGACGYHQEDGEHENFDAVPSQPIDDTSMTPVPCKHASAHSNAVTGAHPASFVDDQCASMPPGYDDLQTATSEAQCADMVGDVSARRAEAPAHQDGGQQQCAALRATFEQEKRDMLAAFEEKMRAMRAKTHREFTHRRQLVAEVITEELHKEKEVEIQSIMKQAELAVAEVRNEYSSIKGAAEEKIAQEYRKHLEDFTAAVDLECRISGSELMQRDQSDKNIQALRADWERNKKSAEQVSEDIREMRRECMEQFKLQFNELKRQAKVVAADELADEKERELIAATYHVEMEKNEEIAVLQAQIAQLTNQCEEWKKLAAGKSTTSAECAAPRSKSMKPVIKQPEKPCSESSVQEVTHMAMPTAADPGSADAEEATLDQTPHENLHAADAQSKPMLSGMGHSRLQCLSIKAHPQKFLTPLKRKLCSEE
ncbi:hypothetical protein CYMTET_9621 [Cymbomonas tetramitiformis]|uniref:Uncharacterized protein n=1 Tax=Cymbomonas tetramitiformis TaxID=36881 RepID=A0AAE0LFA2_9CHLO|nr:hypothetical protein CYMTET_9621 [Cymbomonas tetramitiformis]